jgi:hypothetical protein
MPAHGSHTIHARERPRMSRSVSPIQYTLPLLPTTSRNLGCAGEVILVIFLSLYPFACSVCCWGDSSDDPLRLEAGELVVATEFATVDVLVCVAQQG